MLKNPREYAKAIGAAIVATAAYLMGVVPGDGGLNDLTTVQWLGLIVSLGGTFGITYAVPNGLVSGRRKNELGRIDLETVLSLLVVVVIILLLFRYLV